MALEEIVIKAPQTKPLTDFNAYDFESGFTIVYDPKGNFGVDNQNLYNKIDGVGGMIITPINDALVGYDPASSNSYETGMALHSISHFLLEGSLSLFNAGAITQ